MIVLSVGMPRAGSGWHYNLIHDLMATTGCAEARDIREQYRLHKILTEVNCNIGVLSLRRLGMTLVPALMGNTFVIKAHSAPTRWSDLLIRRGMMRAIYIYRDPRDAMLSAYEYGQRSIEKGRPNFFSRLTNFEETFDFMSEYVRVWEGWMRQDKVLHARYEDLLMSYSTETEHLIKYLQLDAADEDVKSVIERYRPGKAEAGQQGLHFFKGKIGRFREMYTNDQQAQMAERFGKSLKKMGYEV
ncbi:MAG: hypothetical protein B6243_04200 [Anaerolineaceae bacterium 4572_5.2]|nr:MAG: hypothetical protein B6243_04200 [Anaerolineaceae bacterium 4572_5.2]